MEAEENGEVWLIEMLGPRIEIAFDVGANIGSWSDIVLQRCTHLRSLHCYEPSETAANTIQARTENNTHVHLVRAAVSDQEGTALFFEEAGASQTSSLVRHGASSTIQRTVPVITVDGEMHRQCIDHLDILKIDVEGYDLHVLRGAREALKRQAISVVQFEYNLPWMYAGSTLQAAAVFLAECNYELLLLNRTGLCRCDISRLGELFSYLNFVAIPQSELSLLPTDINPDPLWS
ncbi:MAG TPA: FkbM family methyltransferase [Solirubrobacteraceae bacterium]|nr:FkbM family methyltransferase [Solirubrobacteraceae bacterium]